MTTQPGAAAGFHIRACRSTDVDAMIGVFRQSVRRVAIRAYTQAQVIAWAPDEIDRDAWAARYAARLAWVAVSKGQIAGFSDLEGDGLLTMMYVHPDHQGCGIASALLRTVEIAARRCGLPGLRTEASLIARPFFARHGFRLIAPQTVFRHGQTLRNFRMAKPLALPERLADR